MTAASTNWQTRCDACDTFVAVDHTGACAWCGGRVRTSTRPKNQQPWLVTEEILEAAITAYKAGHGVPAIADALLDKTGYASSGSFQGALYVELRRRGVRQRGRAEARVLETRRRAEARKVGVDLTGTQCVAKTVRGERCRRDALRDSDTCHAHGERRHMEFLLERRVAARAKAPRYSDYRALLRAWANAYGRYWRDDVSEISGISKSTLGSILAPGKVDRTLQPFTAAKLERLAAMTPPDRKVSA